MSDTLAQILCIHSSPCVWRCLSRSGSQWRQGRQTHPHTLSDSWLFLHPLTFKERVESFDLLWSRVAPVFCSRLSWALSLGTTTHTHVRTHTYEHTRTHTSFYIQNNVHWGVKKGSVNTLTFDLLWYKMYPTCFPLAPHPTPLRWKGVWFQSQSLCAAVVVYIGPTMPTS